MRHWWWILAFAALALILRNSGESVKPRLTESPTANAVYRTYLTFVANRTCTVNPKRGLGETRNLCRDVAGVCAAWQYGWFYQPLRCDGTESVAMVRDANQQAQLCAMPKPRPPLGNSRWLLGYNEPDLCPAQACLTAEQAVPLWRELEAMFPTYRLVAPVPSQLHLEWIVEFRNAYIAAYGEPPRFDALAVHWYGQRASDAIRLTEWYKARAREWGIAEIWITEFAIIACVNLSLEEAGAEARTLIDYFDSDEMVARYAWFTNRQRADDDWVGQYQECSGSPLFDFTTGKPTFWYDVFAR